MPTAVTHQILAEEVYRRLPVRLRRQISSLPRYFLGAQGPDPWFLCGASGAEENFGRTLHTRATLLFFRILRAESAGDGGMFSYAAGYITHYAADVVFHAYVYGMMEKSGREGKYLHHAIEHALDGALVRAFGGGSLAFFRLRGATDADARDIYKVYARYARATGRRVPARESFVRAVRRYYALNAVRTPLYRAVYAAPAEKLFAYALRESLRLLSLFASPLALRAQDFGRSFLGDVR